MRKKIKFEKKNACYTKLDLSKYKSGRKFLGITGEHDRSPPMHHCLINCETFRITNSKNLLNFYLVSRIIRDSSERLFLSFYLNPTKVAKFSRYCTHDIRFTGNEVVFQLLFSHGINLRIYPFYLMERELLNPKLLVFGKKNQSHTTFSLIISNDYLKSYPCFNLLVVIMRIKPGNLKIAIQKESGILFLDIDLGLICSCPIYMKKKKMLRRLNNEQIYF